MSPYPAGEPVSLSGLAQSNIEHTFGPSCLSTITVRVSLVLWAVSLPDTKTSWGPTSLVFSFGELQGRPIPSTAVSLSSASMSATTTTIAATTLKGFFRRQEPFRRRVSCRNFFSQKPSRMGLPYFGGGKMHAGGHQPQETTQTHIRATGRCYCSGNESTVQAKVPVTVKYKQEACFVRVADSPRLLGATLSFPRSPFLPLVTNPSDNGRTETPGHPLAWGAVWELL